MTAPSAPSRLRRFLEQTPNRTLGLYAAGLGILLTLPSLWSGFAQDDHFFLMVSKGAPGMESLDLAPWETFSFSKGDEALQGELTEQGLLPWWAVNGWKVNFWRPLASLSSGLDYRLFGETAWPMHLHSLLLYGLLILIAAGLYRRLLGSPLAAGLAALLFAIDSGHAIPVAWLSMRNALLTLLFGLLALNAHDAWRRRGRPWQTMVPLALVWLALALLSGESAVALGGYLFAYALFLDPAAVGPDRASGVLRYGRSIGALLPFLAVVVVWRLLYSAQGYGTEGSGLYIDPVADSAIFLGELPARLAVLMLGLLALPDAALWSLGPAPLNHLLLGFAIVVLVAIGWCFRPLLRESNEARFFLLGAVLAAVPACATLPMDRNMMFSSYGGLGLIALFLARCWTPTQERTPRRNKRLMVRFLVFSHVIVAPLGLLAGIQQLPMMDRILTGSNPSIPLDLPPDTRIVALNTPTSLLGASLPIYRSSRGEPVPPHWWWLYAGVRAVAVERTDAHTLVLRPDGGFLTSLWSQVFRHPAVDPMQAGDTVSLEGLEITVLSVTDDGRPESVQFVFDRSLDDPRIYPVTWRNGVYEPFVVPEIGKTGVIAAAEMAPLVPIALGLGNE